MTGLALVTSPDIAKLEKSTDRYMLMETDIEIEGALRTIQVDWRCFQSPSFSAKAGWYMRWQSDPNVGFVAKALPSGKYLIMGTGSIYCSDKSSTEIQHIQNVGLLDTNASTLEILSNREYGKPHDDRIKRSIIRVVATPEKIARTPDEVNVAEQFSSQSPFYATILVNIWGRDPAAKAKIEPLRRLAFASDLHYQVSLNKAGFGTFDDQDGLLPGLTELPIIDGKLDLDNNELKKPGRKIFGLTTNRGRNFKDFEVCYHNQCHHMKIGSGGGDQIYDPETKRIIKISWPSTSIGRNLNQLLE